MRKLLRRILLIVLALVVLMPIAGIGSFFLGDYLLYPQLIYAGTRNKMLANLPQENAVKDIRGVFGPNVVRVCFSAPYHQAARETFKADWVDRDSYWTLAV